MKIKIVAFFLLFIGLAVAQDSPDEVVTEQPNESTIEAAVTDSSQPSQPSEVSNSVDETTNDGDKDLIDLSDPSNSSMTSIQCAQLNRRRNNLLECCEYPHIRFYDIFAKYCVDECVGIKDICCSQVCVWRMTKVINDEGTLNVEGVKETLLDSVMNKAEWTDLVEKHVASCAAEYISTPDTDNYCKLPSRLIEMVTCSMKKLYLECPSMQKSEKCEATKKYVEVCM